MNACQRDLQREPGKKGGALTWSSAVRMRSSIVCDKTSHGDRIALKNSARATAAMPRPRSVAFGNSLVSSYTSAPRRGARLDGEGEADGCAAARVIAGEGIGTDASVAKRRARWAGLALLIADPRTVHAPQRSACRSYAVLEQASDRLRCGQS
jgi:hypothetical protein